MTPETIKHLTLVYGPKGNSDYDLDADRLIYLQPDRMNVVDWDVLIAVADPNAHTKLSHDDAVERVRDAAEKVTLADAADAFLRSLSGWRRGRQRLLSVAYARHIAAHQFDQPDIAKNPKYVCVVCGLQQTVTLNTTWELHALYHGSATNESPTTCLIDLEETLEPEGSTDDGREMLRALLTAIDGLESNLPPSKSGPSDR